MLQLPRRDARKLALGSYEPTIHQTISLVRL
jgi:hypothetical protein